MNYSVVEHDFKKQLTLVDQEYCVVDLIYRLSTNPAAPVKGWCSMKKDEMAEALGYSHRSLSRYFSRLRKLDLIESSQDGKLVKTTDDYNLAKLQFQSAKVASRSPMWRIESANMADTYKVDSKKDIIVCVFKKNEKSFLKVSEGFSSLNLKHQAAAKSLFQNNVARGKYGSTMTLAEILDRYESFLISYEANRSDKSDKGGRRDVASAIGEAVDLSDASNYE